MAQAHAPKVLPLQWSGTELMRLHGRSTIVEVEMSDLELGEKLGDGASGDVFAATLAGEAVALKVPCSRV